MVFLDQGLGHLLVRGLLLLEYDVSDLDAQDSETTGVSSEELFLREILVDAVAGVRLAIGCLLPSSNEQSLMAYRKLFFGDWGTPLLQS